MFRLPRALDPVEQRLLGALLEKEVTTPESYPLTLPALLAASNQKTSRDPVLSLSAAAVEAALARLFEDVLVWREEGPRATRWRHSLDRRWGLRPATKAVLTLLLLRGPQTAGEMRARSDRLHHFADLAEVEAAIAALAAGSEPLVEELPRAPGQKERRFTHCVGTPPVHTGEAAPPPLATTVAPASLDERLRRLEERVDELAAQLAQVSDRLPR